MSTLLGVSAVFTPPVAPTLFSGSVEPSKTLDSSVLSGLKQGDEYYVLPTSGTFSAGMLFKCAVATAGAAVWVRWTALVQFFNTAVTNQSLTVPPFFSLYEFAIIGGGGGGASGGVNSTAGTQVYGGNAGNGGSLGTLRLRAADLPGSLAALFTIGSGGAGGPSQTTDATAGIAGSNGVDSVLKFNGTTILTGTGGSPGKSVTAANTPNFTQSGTGIVAGLGGLASTTVGGGASPTMGGGNGAGSGGSILTTNTAYAGGASAGSSGNATVLSGGAVNANGAAGLPYAYADAISGTPPSGGGASLTAAGGNGGATSNNGAAGAGGGATRVPASGSGTGSAGAPGCLLVVCRP